MSPPDDSLQFAPALLRVGPTEDDARRTARWQRYEAETSELDSRWRVLDEHSSARDAPRFPQRFSSEGCWIAELPHHFRFNVRVQGRTAQPITSSPRVLNGVDRGRNWDRKDNAYFSLDWRVQRAFRIGMRSEIVPSLEMFNTLNNANNVNPLTTPALFNFDGFLRQGVGDPRQVQLAVKVTF